MKHTPGPWRVEFVHGWYFVRANSPMYPQGTPYGAGPVICGLYESRGL